MIHYFFHMNAHVVHSASEKIQKVEQETREVRHTLKNVQSRTDAIKMLVENMRNNGNAG
jgi:hypothetical protein